MMILWQHVFIHDSIQMLGICDIIFFYLCLSLFVCPSVCFTVSLEYSPDPRTPNQHIHTFLSPSCPSNIRNQGLSFAPVAGLWGAAGLPVDSHIKSYSLHRNTIIQGEGGERALSVEYWWRSRAFTRRAQRGLRNMEDGERILKDTVCRT